MLPSSMVLFRQHTIMADLNFGRRDSARLTRGGRATVTCTVLALLAVIASLTNVDHHLSSRRQQCSSRRMRWLAARQSDSRTRYRVDAARRASGVDLEGAYKAVRANARSGESTSSRRSFAQCCSSTRPRRCRRRSSPSCACLGATQLDTCPIVTVIPCGDCRLDDRLRVQDSSPSRAGSGRRHLVTCRPTDLRVARVLVRSRSLPHSLHVTTCTRTSQRRPRGSSP